MQFWKSLTRIVPVLFLLCIAGCGKFFVPETNPTPPGQRQPPLRLPMGRASTITGFSIGTSNLTSTSNSPYLMGVAPSAMAVTPSGAYVYVASLAGAIYGYSVGSNGALSILNSGNALVTGISPIALRLIPQADG